MHDWCMATWAWNVFPQNIKSKHVGGGNTRILWEAIIFDGQGLLHSTHMHGLANETLWGYFKGRPTSIKVYLCMNMHYYFALLAHMELFFSKRGGGSWGCWTFPRGGTVGSYFLLLCGENAMQYLSFLVVLSRLPGPPILNIAKSVMLSNVCTCSEG